MTPFKVTEVDPKAILLENILNMMSGFTFSKNEAKYIVGGEKRLRDLIAAGEIDAVKPSLTQHGKWYCNAAQVLRHCRNTRGKSIRKRTK